MTAKKDATVITQVKDDVSLQLEDTTYTPQQGLNRIDKSCSWKPIYLLSRYKDNKQDDLIQIEYFHHITNNMSRQHWHIGHANVKPGECPDVEMSEVQQFLLNPEKKYVIIGFMTYNVKGKGAVQKITKRKIYCIEGNANSYSKLLNIPKRLEAIK